MRLTGLPRLTFLPRRMRLPAGIAIAALQGYLIAVAVLFVFQRSFVYPTYGTIDQSVPPVGVARVSVPTADGETLFGYWVRPLPGRPLVVSFHGNAGSPLYHAARFAQAPWSGHGWGFLAVAYRGYPGSTGEPTEEGLGRDAEAALAFARENAGPDVPIVLHGHSIGAAVAIGLASRHPVKGLYLEAPFLNLRKAASARFPWLPTWLLLDEYPSEERAPGIAVPALVVHGEDDPVVPAGQGRALAGLFPKGSYREIPHADHASVFGANDVAAEEALYAAATARRVEAGAGRH